MRVLPSAFISTGKKTVKRHPTIEDEVIIYAGATILGGNTVIGKEQLLAVMYGSQKV